MRDSQRPERTVYALTDDGRTELYDWMRELVAEPQHEYLQFGVALSLLSVLSAGRGRRSADQAARVAGRPRSRRSAARSRTATENGVGWVFLIEEEYRLKVLETESEFVTGLMQSLQQPEYVREWHESFREDPMTQVSTALVIGGGVAGPVMALALQKAGIDAEVYEAYSSTADTIGGMLTVAPNGLEALALVGADEAVRDVGQPMSSMIMADGRGRQIGEFPGLDGLPPSRALWRFDLCRVLRDHAVAAGVHIHSGKRLVDAEESANWRHRPVRRRQHGDRGHLDRRRRHSIQGPNPDRSERAGPATGSAVEFRRDIEHHACRRGPMRCISSSASEAFLGYWNQPDGRTGWFSNLPDDTPMTIAQAREQSAEAWLRTAPRGVRRRRTGSRPARAHRS